jgi:hypothetical protein
VRQRLAPPFHLAESQIRREPGWPYIATGHRLPPISSTCCSFLFSPMVPQAWCGESFPLNLSPVWASQCFPIATRLRQFGPFAAAFLATVAEMLRTGVGANALQTLEYPRHRLRGLATLHRNIWQCGRKATHGPACKYQRPGRARSSVAGPSSAARFCDWNADAQPTFVEL